MTLGFSLSLLLLLLFTLVVVVVSIVSGVVVVVKCTEERPLDRGSRGGCSKVVGLGGGCGARGTLSL